MKLEGIPVSPGKVLGKCYVVEMVPEFNLEERSEVSIEEAGKTIEEAISSVLMDLKEAKKLMGHNADYTALIEVQESMLEDCYFKQDIMENIELGYGAAASVLRAAKVQEDMLASLEDPYMVARAEDMHDISRRLACRIGNIRYPDIQGISEQVIVIAYDLLPSMLIGVDISKVKGIVIERGSRTSHVAILAASMDIPTVVNCQGAMEIQNGSLVFIDSEKGEVHRDFDHEECERLMRAVISYTGEKAELKRFAQSMPLSADGQQMMVFANIVDPMVLHKVAENGMDGIGLFRTEFMYMNRKKLPTEDEQYAVYRVAAEKLEGKPVIIRTMDIGGDKTVECLKLPREDNPFMGYRGIRICLDQEHIMLSQLRAILRASAHGDVRIMFPMIATVRELKDALHMLSEAKLELSKHHIPFDPHLRVGIMVEVPSAVVMLDTMAKYLDFVSIGSNDLIQYTYAADRLNKKVGYLYNYMDPAVLRLIAQTIRGAEKAEVECSLCGEMAGEALGMAALTALGLKKFSVSPSLGLMMKKRMSLLNAKELGETGEKMLRAEDADEAIKILKSALPEGYLRYLS